MFSSRKHLYMWLCVVGTASIIGLIWMASLKYNIAATIESLKYEKNDNWEILQNLGSNLGKNYQGMKDIFNQNIAATSTADKKLKN